MSRRLTATFHGEQTRPVGCLRLPTPRTSEQANARYHACPRLTVVAPLPRTRRLVIHESERSCMKARSDRRTYLCTGAPQYSGVGQNHPPDMSRASLTSCIMK